VLVKVRDRVGNEATTQASTLLKTSEPVVTISSPVGGKTISGKTTISGTVQSSLPITSVEVSIDSGKWEKAEGTTSWSYTWDSSRYQDGPHIVRARVVTVAEPSQPQEVAIKTKNGPQVSVDTQAFTIGIILAVILGLIGLVLGVVAMTRKKKGDGEPLPEEGPADGTAPKAPVERTAPPKSHAAPAGYEAPTRTVPDITDKPPGPAPSPPSEPAPVAEPEPEEALMKARVRDVSASAEVKQPEHGTELGGPKPPEKPAAPPAKPPEPTQTARAKDVSASAEVKDEQLEDILKKLV
jgi:hypothetical protein